MAKEKKRYKKITSIPGIIVECKSGWFVAYYEHRTDIIANGENEREVKKNLKEMYEDLIRFEEEEAEKKTSATLPKGLKTRHFTQRLKSA
jgi:predicted RNase H-like HicB family nuclease